MSQKFMDRNFPTLYLYGDGSLNNEDAARVRIAYSREKQDSTRDSKDGDWSCRVVSAPSRKLDSTLTMDDSAITATTVLAIDVLDAPLSNLVRFVLDVPWAITDFARTTSQYAEAFKCRRQ